MRGDGFGKYSPLPYPSLHSNLTWGIRNNSTLFDTNHREAYLGRNIEWLYTISVSLYVTRMNDQPSPGNLTLCLLFYSCRHVDQYRLWIVFVLLRHTGEWRVESGEHMAVMWGVRPAVYFHPTHTGWREREREGLRGSVHQPGLARGNQWSRSACWWLVVTGGDQIM